MMDIKEIIQLIKSSVHITEPKATVVLFGSYVRGDYKVDSDVDILILVDKTEVTRTDQRRIKYPLYDIEFTTGTIISPMVFSRNDWESRHRNTPFYDQITKEGKIL